MGSDGFLEADVVRMAAPEVRRSRRRVRVKKGTIPHRYAGTTPRAGGLRCR